MKPPKRKHTTNDKIKIHSTFFTDISPIPRDQAKILIAVGIPMTAVAAEKYSCELLDMPTENM